MTWPQIKKVFILKCHLLLLYTIVSLSDCDVQWKSGLFMTPGDDQLNGWTKKKLQSTSQSQTCTKKGHGHCLVVSCPSGPLDLFESLQNHYIWEVCSANRWDALKMDHLQPALVNRMGLILLHTHHTTSASKVEWIGLLSFASSATFTRPLANWLPLLQASQQLFAEKTLPQPARDRKYFPRVIKSRCTEFYATGNKLISLWQKCVDCNGSNFNE